MLLRTCQKSSCPVLYVGLLRRPIVVGEPAMRVLGILFNDRLVDFKETHDLRSPVQTGFRPALSCRHPLLTLQHYIYQQVQHKKAQLFCCFIDLKGAYNSVPCRQLWQTVAGLAIHGNMLKGVKAMYINSQAAVKVAGRHGNMHKSCLGVKQGCHVSPTLFGLYMYGLFEYLQSVEGGAAGVRCVHCISLLVYRRHHACVPLVRDLSRQEGGIKHRSSRRAAAHSPACHLAPSASHIAAALLACR